MTSTINDPVQILAHSDPVVGSAGHQGLAATVKPEVDDQLEANRAPTAIPHMQRMPRPTAGDPVVKASRCQGARRKSCRIGRCGTRARCRERNYRTQPTCCTNRQDQDNSPYLCHYHDRQPETQRNKAAVGYGSPRRSASTQRGDEGQICFPCLRFGYEGASDTRTSVTPKPQQRIARH